MNVTQRTVCRSLRATRLAPETITEISGVPLSYARACQQRCDPRWKRPDVAKFASSANSAKADTRAGAARGPKCPAIVLEQLARDEVWSVRAEVAQKRSSPERLVRRLSVDCHPAVRAAVARNKNCPPEVLRRLAADSNEDVRQTALRNPVRACWMKFD